MSEMSQSSPSRMGTRSFLAKSQNSGVLKSMERDGIDALNLISKKRVRPHGIMTS
jgi:hypothetical protein